jgi:hypothetical protein
MARRDSIGVEASQTSTAEGARPSTCPSGLALLDVSVGTGRR